MSRKHIGRVGVLAGGPSNEREISLRSGRAVHANLVQAGLDAVLIDVRDDVHGAIRGSDIGVAFIALHGRFGEDGTIQKILEGLGIPYTGSGPAASKEALDKALTKAVFRRSGIPTPDYAVVEKGVPGIESCRGLGFPVVVKPHLEGSSIGLSIVNDEGSLKAAIDKAFEYGDLALVEKHISGRELTVGMLNDEPLPVIEIVTKGNIYDYEAKYSDPETRYLVPAPLDEDASNGARDLGRRAHRALGCRCFSRVDMIMDRENGLTVLEVNTIPGMTERSLLPKAAGAIGLSFGDLCIRLIEDAIKR